MGVNSNTSSTDAVRGSRDVAIALFDDVEILDFCGPYEVFSVANRYRDESAFNVYTVAETDRVNARNGLSVVVDFLLDSAPRCDVVLVPGGVGTRAVLKNETYLNWIKRSCDDAELILSVCTGSLLLGRLGLLEGLRATTHHSAFQLLREIAPSTEICEHERYVDNGRVITSGGIAAGIDMSLYVVSRLLGKSAAIATARHMEYPWNP